MRAKPDPILLLDVVPEDEMDDSRHDAQCSCAIESTTDMIVDMELGMADMDTIVASLVEVSSLSRLVSSRDGTCFAEATVAPHCADKRPDLSGVDAVCFDASSLQCPSSSAETLVAEVSVVSHCAENTDGTAELVDALAEVSSSLWRGPSDVETRDEADTMEAHSGEQETEAHQFGDHAEDTPVALAAVVEATCRRSPEVALLVAESSVRADFVEQDIDPLGEASFASGLLSVDAISFRNAEAVAVPLGVVGIIGETCASPEPVASISVAPDITRDIDIASESIESWPRQCSIEIPLLPRHCIL